MQRGENEIKIKFLLKAKISDDFRKSKLMRILWRLFQGSFLIGLEVLKGK
jgi:hypothetical protein